MSITKDKKQALIKEYAQGTADTGSVEVQCAILTEKIINLTEHCKKGKKDFQSHRGLLVWVNRRKRLLRYLQRTNIERYQALIKKLGIRG
jgi:small subunit ribosomal protein S15